MYEHVHRASDYIIVMNAFQKSENIHFSFNVGVSFGRGEGGHLPLLKTSCPSLNVFVAIGGSNCHCVHIPVHSIPLSESL